jgi:hypothetical protein
MALGLLGLIHVTGERWAAQAPPPRAIFAPETLVYPGNAVRLQRAGRLLLVLQYWNGRNFEIGRLESADDGRSWMLAEPIASDSAASYYDPMVLRTARGHLLLGSHREGTLRFVLSRDDGRTWAERGRLVPPGGTAYAEVFLRWAGPLGRDRDRVALAYAAIDATGNTSWYELRASSDEGRTWSTPTVVGSADAIGDALRAGLGPVRSDGTLLAVFSRRARSNDTVEVNVARIDARSLKIEDGPRRITRVPDVAPGVGVFPIVAECPNGPVVLFSTWNRRGKGSLRILRSGADLEWGGGVYAGTEVVAQSGVLGGFGRVWLTQGWSLPTRAVYVAVPTSSSSRIEYLQVPELDSCRF